MINTEEILVVNTIGILILLISLISRIESKKKRNLSDRLFDGMIGVTFGALLAETATFLLDGKPGVLVHCLQYLLNAYLFLASCGLGMLWVLYVHGRINRSAKSFPKWLLSVVLPFVLVFVLVVCDMFGTGLMFFVTEQNVYRRGSLMLLPFVFLYYDYIISIVMAVAAAKRNGYLHFFPVQYFILPCMIGTVVQIFCYGLSVGWCSVSLAFIFVQMQLYNQNAFFDDLSGLYNRKYYNCVIDKLANSRRNKPVSGIMMDINRFKDINDQFGHSVGDDAVRSLGVILKNVTNECDMVFRYAGDEFIIISTGMERTYTQRLVDAIGQKLDVFNETAGKPYKLSVAIGYAVCDTDSLSFDSFLHQMDMKMYEAKAAYYGTKSGRNHRIAEQENNAQF